MAMSDKRRYKTCIVCRKRIEQDTLPWSMVSVTGDTVFWHPSCDDDHEEARRG